MVNRSSPSAKPVTMKDVARLAGVSQSTVSRILSRTPQPIAISEATRKRVEETAQQLGFRPNPFARALRGGPTKLLGVLVRDIGYPVSGAATEALSLEAYRNGYNVVLGVTHGSDLGSSGLEAVLGARDCDAVIVVGDNQDQESTLAELRAANVPVVVLWHGTRLNEISTVDVDNSAGVAQALRHLTELGHERIAFIGSEVLDDTRERQAAFVDSVGPLPHGYLQRVVNQPAGGAAALDALMNLPRPPTAVMAATDILALGALHAAQRRGVRVPEDLSVVGFDDIPLAAYAAPGLTTLRMPIDAMVAAATALVAAAAARHDVTPVAPVHEVFAPELMVRQSTAPVREGRDR